MPVIGANEIVSILQLGFSGVAFLFLYMSFSLLSKEQQRKEEPRDKILKSIRSFSFFTVAFAVLVLASTALDYVLKETTLPERCENAVLRAAELSNNDGHDLSSMRDLLKNTISQCEK
ncbi:hypothetical protein NBRC116587_22690 [Pseudoteredinibacter isoporae]